MMGPREIARRFAALLTRRRWERDFDDELRAHLEFAVDDYLRRGFSRAESRRRALIDLGGVEATRQRHREGRGLPSLDALLQDLSFAVRALRRNPTLTGFALATIALGVGGSVAVFSVVSVPLPFEEAERLVWIQNSDGPTRSHQTIQVGHYQALRERSTAFTELGAYGAFEREGALRVSAPGSPARYTGAPVTAGFFPTLGVQPAMGRFFGPDDDYRDGPPVVVISDRLWRGRFGADRNVVGQSLTINDVAHTVVGVLPTSFDFATVFQPGAPVDLLIPFGLTEGNNRRGNTLFVLGRLAPGSNVAEARAEVETIAAASSSADLNDYRPRVMPLREHVRGDAAAILTILSGAVLLTMLIVCVNLSNLLLTRASAREREMAVRAALGANRGRLVRQALTESLVLAALGSCVGLVLASIAVRVLAGMQTLRVPLRELVRIDAGVLVFAVGVTVVCGIGFGLLPALRVSSNALARSFNGSGRSMSEERRHAWSRNALIVCEVALTAGLLVGAGLLTRSLVQLLDTDPGFAPESVVALRIDRGSASSERAEDRVYFGEALAAARSTGGVEAVGLVDTPPLGFNRMWSAGAVGRSYERGEKPTPYIHVVSEGYLETMGISLLRGRDFAPSDNVDVPRVALVNESLAEALWPGLDPIGRRLDTSSVEYVVVGLVRDVRHLGIDRDGGPELYISARQSGDFGSIYLAVRGQLPPAELLALTRAAVQPIDPSVPLTQARVMQTVIDASVSSRRFAVLLMVGFAAFSVALACLGIYGVITFAVGRRRREMGVRLAMGATPVELRRKVVAETMRLIAVGAVLGLGAGAIAARSFAATLYGVAPIDPATFAGSAILLILVGLLAAYAPARQAARTELVTALLQD